MPKPNTYGKETHAINQGIKNGEAGKLANNQAVRKYAERKYYGSGLTMTQVKERMARKDAGHIVSRNCGGRNTAGNYMWEDRHNNRAHGDKPISKEELKRGGRA
jgi:hypothetical protein